MEPVHDLQHVDQVDDLAVLVGSWELSLSLDRSPATIRAYREASNQLIAFLRTHGMPTAAPHVRREHIEASRGGLKAGGRPPATVATRYGALRQFFAWLAEEGEITDSPMRNMHPPKVPEPQTPVLSEDDVRKLFDACKGS